MKQAHWITILNCLHIAQEDISNHDCDNPECEISDMQCEILEEIAETIDAVMEENHIGVTLQ